jgi:phage protein D
MAAILHTPSAQFTVESDGIDITQHLNKYLIHLTITNAMAEMDKCEILLDDADGQIQFPTNGSVLTAGLGWADTGPLVVFQAGFVIVTKSQGSRAHGRTLLISAEGANMTMQSSLKATQNAHMDSGSLQEAANQFIPNGALVKVLGSLGAKRTYWSIGQENFMSWLNNRAAEVGGEVSVDGNMFVVSPFGSNQSASGGTIPNIECDVGPAGNVIEWDIFPQYSRLQFGSHQVMSYDILGALLQNIGDGGGGTGSIAGNKFKLPFNEDKQAQTQSESNKKKHDQSEKGGTLTIIGEPKAKVRGTVSLTGARNGVDGSYSIHRVGHTYSRSGFQTALQLVNPGQA